MDENGIYGKFRVTKADGTPVDNCFILRPERDPAAVSALRAYATATENEQIREDLYRWVGKPMQKPLTLEELKALCETGSHCIYIEHYHANPDIENPITPNVGIKSGRGYRITHCNGYRYKFMWTDYGKTWRAWISMPTDEERKAAPWEV